MESGIENVNAEVFEGAPDDALVGGGGMATGESEIDGIGGGASVWVDVGMEGVDTDVIEL